jgi:hypothetical protein
VIDRKRLLIWAYRPSTSIERSQPDEYIKMLDSFILFQTSEQRLSQSRIFAAPLSGMLNTPQPLSTPPNKGNNYRLDSSLGVSEVSPATIVSGIRETSNCHFAFRTTHLEAWGDRKPGVYLNFLRLCTVLHPVNRDRENRPLYGFTLNHFSDITTSTEISEYLLDAQQKRNNSYIQSYSQKHYLQGYRTNPHPK